MLSIVLKGVLLNEFFNYLRYIIFKIKKTFFAILPRVLINFPIQKFNILKLNIMKYYISYLLFFLFTSFFVVFASPKIAPHLNQVFTSTGENPYQKRLPWAIKKKQQLYWLDEFGYLQIYRKKFLLKGHSSIEELLKFRKQSDRHFVVTMHHMTMSYMYVEISYTDKIINFIIC